MQSTVRIHEGADPTLSNNQIFGGRCAAVSFDAGASGTLLKNAVKAHAGPAVDVHSFAKKVLIDGNALSDCTVGIIVHDQGVHSAGASLSGGGGGTGAGFSEVTAERNDIFENRVAGIELLGLTACAHPQFSANRVHDELGCGIRCGALSTGRFDDNEVFNSRGNGVEVLLNATPLLRRNTVSNCKGHGIAVMLGGGVYVFIFFISLFLLFSVCPQPTLLLLLLQVRGQHAVYQRLRRRLCGAGGQVRAIRPGGRRAQRGGVGS